VRGTTGDRILPALYNDNFITLLPGEKRTLRTELQEADTAERIRDAVTDSTLRTPAIWPTSPEVGQFSREPT